MHRIMLAGRVVGSIGAIALITGLYAQFLLRESDDGGA